MWARKKGSGILPLPVLCRELPDFGDYWLATVDSLQRRSWDVSKTWYVIYASVFEGCQHQSVANQQSPKSGDSLHKMGNGSTPNPFFLAHISKKKSGLATRDYSSPTNRKQWELRPDQFDSTTDYKGYIVSRSQTAIFYLILGWENIGSGILTVKLSQLSPVLR